MANQLNVNRYRCNVMTDLDTAAKLRTYVKGKTVAAKSVGGRVVRKATRPMTIGDLLEQKAIEIADGVKMDAESREWMMKQYQVNVKKRAAADSAVKAGRFRKPKSEWLKPGRVKGKKYPKHDAAMKKLGEQRKAMTAAGKSWHHKKAK